MRCPGDPTINTQPRLSNVSEPLTTLLPSFPELLLTLPFFATISVFSFLSLSTGLHCKCAVIVLTFLHSATLAPRATLNPVCVTENALWINECKRGFVRLLALQRGKQRSGDAVLCKHKMAVEIRRLGEELPVRGGHRYLSRHTSPVFVMHVILFAKNQLLTELASTERRNGASIA